jgi:protein SCO1
VRQDAVTALGVAARCAGLIVLLAAAIGAVCAADEPPRDHALSTNPKLAVIARAPDFALRDFAGNDVRLADQRGRVVLLAFIFTSCKSVCPLISQQMARLQGALKEAAIFASKATMLSVSVDPKTDTAEVLAQYATGYGADPAGWRFLRESPEKTAPILKAYDEWTKQLPAGDLDHPARVYLIDQRGAIREVYSLSFFDEKQAYLDIQALLREAN